MNKVVDLTKHKQTLRRDYLKNQKLNINQFLSHFLETNLVFSLESILSDYKSSLIHMENTAWDYQDLRDILVDYFEELYGEKLMQAINKEAWYDKRYLSLDTLLDKCISILVLRKSQPQQERRKNSHLKSV